jgi:hypothetical protein
MPVWSWPRNPGTPSARAAVAPASTAGAGGNGETASVSKTRTGMGDRTGLPEILGAMVVRA